MDDAFITTFISYTDGLPTSAEAKVLDWEGLCG